MITYASSITVILKGPQPNINPIKDIEPVTFSPNKFWGFPIVTPGKNKQTMAKTAKTAAIICKTFESLSFILPLLFLNFPSIFNIS